MISVKEIKYKRLSKEERFFLETIGGMQIKKQDKYPKSVFWEKNGVILFEQDFKFKHLYVNYDKIWGVFVSKFVLNSQEIINLIKGLVEEHLNWKGLEPCGIRRPSYIDGGNI